MFHVKHDQNMSKLSQNTGKIGEKIAETFLMKQGFTISDRNFREKWGEIDIVAKKGEITHFVEVKTKEIKDVSHETLNDNFPEERINSKKILRLKRIIESYSLEKGTEEIKVSVVAVLLDKNTKKGHLRFYPEIVLE